MFKNKAREVADVAADSMKDTARDTKFAIEDSEAGIVDRKEQVVKTQGATNVLKRELEGAKREGAKFLKIAKAKGADGDESATREALTRKATADTRAKVLANEIAQNEKTIANVRAGISRDEQRIASAKSNVALLKARKQNAQARSDLAKAAAGLQSNNPLAALDDLEKEVNQLEGEADAVEEMAGVGDASLEEQFDAEQSDDKVEAELARLLQTS